VERVTLVSAETGAPQIEHADAVFVFIGTRPRSEWLPPSVLRDQKGFVLTGRELMANDSYRRAWKESRDPGLLETSSPGIFAAGDVRAAAMNRVAAAVGEGAMAVRLAHEYLAMH
jgi:thioredoxin reductase (NADPH)